MTNLNALLPRTRRVLEALAELPVMKDYTLVGGSAIGIYLSHRQSEDLDFFTWLPELPRATLLATLSHAFTDLRLLKSDQLQIDCTINRVRVTFFANDWQALKTHDALIGNVNITPLPTLTALKVNTLFVRAKFRDYYDLYAIARHGYSVKKIYEIAVEHIPSLTLRLFQIALIYVDDIVDDKILHLSPRYDIRKEDIGKYFEAEIKTWLKSIDDK